MLKWFFGSYKAFTPRKALESIAEGHRDHDEWILVKTISAAPEQPGNFGASTCSVLSDSRPWRPCLSWLPLPRDHIGRRETGFLSLYTGVHSAQDEMKLRLLTQIDLKHTICIKLLYLENPDYSLNPSVWVVPSFLHCLPTCLWSSCWLHSCVTSPELEPTRQAPPEAPPTGSP